MEKQNNITSYSFKLLMSTWGIVIDIEAFSEPLIKRDNIGQVQLSEMIWLSIDQQIQLSTDEKKYILTGLQAISDKIEKTISRPVKIVIQHIGRIPCDYQEEGLYYAVQGWAAKHFNFVLEGVHARFDSEKNVYVFPDMK